MKVEDEQKTSAETRMNEELYGKIQDLQRENRRCN